MEFTEEEGNLPNGCERALLPQGCSSTQHPEWTALLARYTLKKKKRKYQLLLLRLSLELLLWPSGISLGF